VLHLPLLKETGRGPGTTRGHGAETTAASGAGPQQTPPPPRAETAARRVPRTHDDRDSIVPGDRVVLIVESDTRFAATLLDIAQEHGFKGVIASDGGALWLWLSAQAGCDHAGSETPGRDGWVVLERLKHSAQTRHIP